MASLSDDESFWSSGEENKTYRVEKLNIAAPVNKRSECSVPNTPNSITRPITSSASEMRLVNPAIVIERGSTTSLINPAIVIERGSTISLHQGAGGGGDSSSKTNLIPTEYPSPVKCMSTENGLYSQARTDGGGETAIRVVSNVNREQREVLSRKSSSEQIRKVQTVSSFPKIDAQKFDSSSSSEGSEEPGLTAWERWFIEKEKQNRAKAEAKRREEMQKKLEQQKLEREKQEKKKIERLNWQLWLQKKREQELQKQIEEQKKREKDEIKKMRERELRKRAEIKYGEWLVKKEQEMKGK